MKALSRMTLRELHGRSVRSLVQMTTKGGVVFGAGTVFKVTGKFSGLQIEQTSICSACGCGAKRTIARVSPLDLELLPEESREVGP